MPPIALAASSLLLITSLAAIALAIFNGSKLHYDATLPIFFGLRLIGTSFVALAVAIVAVVKDFGWLSIAGLLVSIVALIASCGALFMIGATMLANHPV